MVCDRCKMAVKSELEKSGIEFNGITLGEIDLKKEPSEQQLDNFKTNIVSLGFELIEDKTARLISGIKNAALEFVRQPSGKNLKFSVYLTERLHKDYNYLSHLFSTVEGSTIEQYLIHQKIEKVKELLVYDELSLSQIADDLGYSSVQHLSNQFKKVTGLTPRHFKSIKENRRLSLDQI